VSEREVFGDFRSACHDGDLTGAARCLRRMNGEGAVVAFDYAARHFQRAERTAWFAIETLELLREASLADVILGSHGSPTAEEICAVIEPDELRVFMRAIARCSIHGWTASFEGGQRAFLFGLESVRRSLDWLFPYSLVRIMRDAREEAPKERVHWFQRFEEQMPPGLLPVFGTTSPLISGEIWWLVCNGENAGKVVPARYAYDHTIADGENIHWQELVARAFRCLLTQEPNEVLANDPNHEMRLAFWEDLIDPSKDVELFRP